MINRFALVLAAFALFGASAHAFTLNRDIYARSGTGEQIEVISIGWQKKEIVFDLDSNCTAYGDRIRAVVNQAMGFWNGIPSADLTVRLGDTVTVSRTIPSMIASGAPEGNPLIMCDADFAANSSTMAANRVDPDSIPGYASGSLSEIPSGRYKAGMLVLNVEPGKLANVTTLSESLAAVVLAHEMGHVLGLGHSSDGAALMYYSVTPSRQLSLAQDDLDGITYLYPRDEPTGFLGCGSIAAVGGVGSGYGQGGGKGSGPASGVELAVIAGMMFVGWAVMRRHPIARAASMTHVLVSRDMFGSRTR